MILICIYYMCKLHAFFKAHFEFFLLPRWLQTLLCPPSLSSYYARIQSITFLLSYSLGFLFLVPQGNFKIFNDRDSLLKFILSLSAPRNIEKQVISLWWDTYWAPVICLYISHVVPQSPSPALMSRLREVYDLAKNQTCHNWQVQAYRVSQILTQWMLMYRIIFLKTHPGLSVSWLQLLHAYCIHFWKIYGTKKPNKII